MDTSQPIGEPVPRYTPPPHPSGVSLTGRTVRVVPLDIDAHGTDLYAAYAGHDALWTYMPTGPFPDEASFSAFLTSLRGSLDPTFFAFCTPGGKAIGMGSFLRIAPDAGSIEVGYLAFSPRMQRRVAATEAMFLMMEWAFEAGYRRYEWKCNALNMPSRRAAQRLGLSYEGVFRQAVIVKGRNRDTAWFAAIDKDWPALKSAFETWLAPANFDAEGRQKTSLSGLTAPILHLRDPLL